MPVAWEHYIDIPVEADAAAIAALEERMAISLPEEVRKILLDHAGHVTEPSAVIVGENRETPFSPILYVGGKKGQNNYTYSVEFALSTLEGWAGVDEMSSLKLFPFASNSAAGYFCLDFRNSLTSPPIVFVDLNYDLDEQGAIKPAADDFGALLTKLY